MKKPQFSIEYKMDSYPTKATAKKSYYDSEYVL